MQRPHTRSTHTDTLFPFTTLFRSQVAKRGEIALAALGRIEAAEERLSVAQLLHGDTKLVALRGGQLRKAPAALQRLAVALGEQRVGESDERLGERPLPCRLPCRFWAPAAIQIGRAHV